MLWPFYLYHSIFELFVLLSSQVYCGKSIGYGINISIVDLQYNIVHCVYRIVFPFFLLWMCTGLPKEKTILLTECDLKGQCHEIFDFWFFSWISFPQSPEYTMRAVSNFFKNSRRYSQLNFCHRCQRHRWQMQKIFNHKSFNYLV